MSDSDIPEPSVIATLAQTATTLLDQFASMSDDNNEPTPARQESQPEERNSFTEIDMEAPDNATIPLVPREVFPEAASAVDETELPPESELIPEPGIEEPESSIPNETLGLLDLPTAGGLNSNFLGETAEDETILNPTQPEFENQTEEREVIPIDDKSELSDSLLNAEKEEEPQFYGEKRQPFVDFTETSSEHEELPGGGEGNSNEPFVDNFLVESSPGRTQESVELEDVPVVQDIVQKSSDDE
jgi:hypothetical protein